MKRLVWLLLFVCPLAFAKVQPVIVEAEKAEACCCCESTGSCDMPDCAPPPASPTVNLDRPATKLRSETRKTVKAKATVRVSFYSAYAEPAEQPARPKAPTSLGQTVQAPLFQVHCSFLI